MVAMEVSVRERAGFPSRASSRQTGMPALSARTVSRFAGERCGQPVRHHIQFPAQSELQKFELVYLNLYIFHSVISSSLKCNTSSAADLKTFGKPEDKHKKSSVGLVGLIPNCGTVC